MPAINPYNDIVRKVTTKFKCYRDFAFNDRRRTGTRRLSYPIPTNSCIWVYIFILMEIKERLDESGLEYLELYIHHNKNKNSYFYRTKICIVIKA
jgi:hypothetical protein